MDLKHKYTAICKDCGEEITGYLVISEGSVNKGMAYICPETSIVEFKGTVNGDVPVMALGPFYHVIPDTIVPAEEDEDSSTEAVDIQLLQRYKDAITIEDLEGLLEVLDKHHVDLENAAADGLDAILKESMEYRKSGLSAEDVNEIIDVLRKTGLISMRMPPKDEISEWIERMRWHVRKVDELAEENKRLKTELVGYKYAKAESIKKALLQWMDAEYARDAAAYMRKGVAFVEKAAPRLALNKSIISVFKDLPLNLSQCENLMLLRYSILAAVRLTLCNSVKPGMNPIFGVTEVEDAIYEVADKAGEKRGANRE